MRLTWLVGCEDRMSCFLATLEIIAHLVQKKQVGVVEHSSGELKLHLPTAGESADHLGLPPIIKANFGQLVANLGPPDVLQLRIWYRKSEICNDHQQGPYLKQRSQ